MTSARRSPLHLAALASAAVKGLDPVTVEAVHGDDERCDVAYVRDTKDRRWVVRVPRSVADAAQMEAAAALLPHLDKRLPFDVPTESGSIPLRDNGRAMVFPLVEGHRLDLARVPAGPGLAAALGRALGEIHNLDPGLFDEAGLPSYDADAYRQRHLTELDRGAATGHVPSTLLTRWERALETVAHWRFAPAPVHGRLSGDLVLAEFDSPDDAATGRIIAVMGWDQAKVADPAEDFAALCSQASPDAFDTVLEAYAATRHERPDRALEMRARLMGELRLVRDLVHACAADDEQAVEDAERGLRRLARDVEGDDLVAHVPAVTVPGPVGSLDEGEWPAWSDTDPDAGPGATAPADATPDEARSDGAGPGTAILEPVQGPGPGDDASAAPGTDPAVAAAAQAGPRPDEDDDEEPGVAVVVADIDAETYVVDTGTRTTTHVVPEDERR